MPKRVLSTLAAALVLSITTARADPCPDRGFEFFEIEGYRVKNVRVTGFWVLRRAMLAGNTAVADLAGKPFTAAGILKGKRALRDQLIAAPALFDSPVGVTVAAARVANCSAATKELDIEYPLFTTKMPLASIHTAEQASLEHEDPARALALAPANTRYRIAPMLGYDASQNVLGGGRLDVPSLFGTGIQLSLEGQGSSETTAAAISLAGGAERESGWLERVVWRGAFAYSDRPSDRLRLHSSRASGQVSLSTRAIGRIGAVVRFGSLFEGGSQRTGLTDAVLPSDLLASSRFGNWRSYAGVTARTRRSAMAASYGVLLGRTGSGKRIDYRKQVLDVVYESRFLLAAQRPLSVETRFTAGALARLGPTPVSERFFGGNVETTFIPGSEWSMRANPVMRGIPAFRLNRVAPGDVPGGDHFAVLNLTVSVPVFGLPVIPKEAAENEEIRQAISGFVTDGADALAPIYELDDPAQKHLFDTVREGLARTTAAMEERVGAIEASVPEALKPAHQACADKIGDLASDASSITRTTPWRMFVNPDPEERGIPVIVDVCIMQLNSKLMDAELAERGDELKSLQQTIQTQVDKIDRTRARQLAQETMAFPSRVVQTIFDEMTVVSLSPLFLFDAGRIGPEVRGWRSTRYSLGGGARLTLASSVSFEFGYAWNLRPQPWEGRGALFVALRFLDIFGK